MARILGSGGVRIRDVVIGALELRGAEDSLALRSWSATTGGGPGKYNHRRARFEGLERAPAPVEHEWQSEPCEIGW